MSNILDTLQAYQQANPYNSKVNEAFLGALTNPALNGSLANILGGGQPGGLGSDQSGQISNPNPQSSSMPSLPSDPRFMTTDEKALYAKMQNSNPNQSGQPNSSSYDSSFLNNIPIFGGVLNALGRTSAAGASGVSSLLSDAGALATGHGDKLSNPLQDAMQGLEDPNKAQYLGTQLANKGVIDQNSGLKGILDTGSSVLLDPSLYLGGMGVLGKLGEGANAAVKGVTGLDALGVSGDVANGIKNAVGNIGNKAGVAADTFDTLSPEAQKILQQTGGIADTKSWQVPEQIKQANQSANYGMDFTDNGQQVAQQSQAVRSGMGNALNDTLANVKAPINYDDLLGNVKKSLTTQGYDDNIINKVSNTIDNLMTARNNGQGLTTMSAGDANAIEQQLGKIRQTYIGSDNPEHQAIAGAIKDTQTGIMDSLHNATSKQLGGKPLFTNDQVNEIIDTAKLNPATQGALIDDIKNARTIQDVKNIHRNMYYNSDLANQAFPNIVKDASGNLRIPTKTDVLNMVLNHAVKDVSGIKNSVTNGVGNIADILKNNYSGGLAKDAAQSGVGQLVGANKGVVGGALDRATSSGISPTPQQQTINTNGNTDLNTLLDSNKIKNQNLYQSLILSKMDPGTAKAFADSKYPLLNGEQSGKVNNIKDSLSAVDQLQTAYNNLHSMKGPIGGDISNILGNIGIDQNTKNYNNVSAGLLASLKQAVGDGNLAQVAGLIPSVNDSPQSAQIKIQQLKQLLNSKAQNTLQLVGR